MLVIQIKAFRWQQWRTNYRLVQLSIHSWEEHNKLCWSQFYNNIIIIIRYTEVIEAKNYNLVKRLEMRGWAPYWIVSNKEKSQTFVLVLEFGLIGLSLVASIVGRPWFERYRKGGGLRPCLVRLWSEMENFLESGWGWTIIFLGKITKKVPNLFEISSTSNGS